MWVHRNDIFQQKNIYHCESKSKWFFSSEEYFPMCKFNVVIVLNCVLFLRTFGHFLRIFLISGHFLRKFFFSSNFLRFFWFLVIFWEFSFWSFPKNLFNFSNFQGILLIYGNFPRSFLISGYFRRNFFIWYPIINWTCPPLSLLPSSTSVNFNFKSPTRLPARPTRIVLFLIAPPNFSL